MKVSIEKVVYGGEGLARIPEGNGPQSGMRIFVPFTLPGETVEVEVVRTHRGYCEGIAHSIERPAEFRTMPSCLWFGVCGGCQLQHADYPNQVAMKSAMLAESLSRAGIRELPVIDTLTGGPLGYRNRIRLQVRTQPMFSIGYRQARSHRIVAIDHCPIAMPILQKAIAALKMLGTERRIPSEISEVEFFTNHDHSEMLLTAWTSDPGPVDTEPWTEFFFAVQQVVPTLSGAAVFPSNQTDQPDAKPLLQWGNCKLQYRVAERDYTVSLGSFFQTNSTLLDDFVREVIGNETGGIAWDLYAGVGLFSAPLAERFSHITAVEANPVAARDLRQNLRGGTAHIVQRTTLDFLKSATPQVKRRKLPQPDLVLLDPPRAGAGAAVCRDLAYCGPRHIVYVSCDPATLGRDLAALIQSGYRLQRLRMVDMFPQTSHLETVAMLER
jgi:23S rRNA (uracil1939-C5)-methyltransferase